MVFFYPICQSDSQKYWKTTPTGNLDSLIVHTWHLQCKSLYLGARVTVPEVAEMILSCVIILWVSRLFSYPDGKTSVWVWDCEWTGHAHSKYNVHIVYTYNGWLWELLVDIPSVKCTSVKRIRMFTVSTCWSDCYHVSSFSERRSLLMASQTEPDSGGVCRW